MKLRMLSLIALAAVALSTGKVHAIELIYGTGSGAKSRINIDAIEPFMAATSKESNGSLTWKYMPGNQIVSVRNAIKGLRDGLVDSAMVVPVFARKELIQNNIMYDTYYFGGDDPIAAAGAAHETIMLNCPSCVKEYKDNNAFLLSSYGGSGDVLVCNKPVRTLDDVKGLKIRASGAQQRIVNAMGAVPVALPPQELTLALERGGLDCAVMALNWMVSFGVQDVAKHVLDFSMGSSRGLGLIVMRRQSWDRLTSEQRKILWKHAPLASARAVATSYVALDKRYRETAKEKGITFYQAGSDFEKVRDQVLAEERKAIISAIEAQGAKNVPAVVDAFLRNLDKWRKISGDEIKDDPDAYARALEREVYSKLDPEKL